MQLIASVIFDLRRSVVTVASAVVFMNCLMSHPKASKISSLVQQHIWPPWPARLRVDENHIFRHDNPRDVQAATEDRRYGRVPEVDLLNIFPYDIVRFLGGLEY